MESTQQRSRFGRTNIFLGSSILGLYSKKMRNKQRYCGQLQNHVRIANFRGREQRNYHSLKIFVFLHGLMIWLIQLKNQRLREIYFIDPEDKELKETIENARKKLETSVAPAVPCKIVKNCGSGASNKIKNKTCVYSGS